MMIHIPESISRPPPKSSKTLCDKMIGTTHGIITLDNFINPVRGKAPNKSYEVWYTKKGYDWMKKRAPLRNVAGPEHLFKDRGYWIGYIHGRGIRMCQHCQESDKFGMMVLAEL